MRPFTIISLEELEDIHQATLRVLAEVGIVLKQPSGRAILTGAGCTVQGERVLFPSELVEKCIAQCPPQVSVKGRNGNVKTLGDGSLHFHNLGGARDIFDASTGQSRNAGIQDVCDATRLLDALENCHTITPFFTPCEVPGALMSLSMYRHALPYTLKPVQGPGVQYPGEVKFALRMAAVIGEPSDVLTLSVSPVSPLAYPDHEVEAIIEIARAGIAFGPLPCPTAGTTAPFSIAGALTQQNAEVLSALVLAQLVRPGLPIIYCGRLAMMEPRTGVSIWGGVELAIASAATVQIGHRYNLPVNVYGFSSNAHTLDLQNGFERGINAALPVLAGADEISGIGEMEAGISGSFAQMVADNEFAGSISRLKRGFGIDTDSLAVDVIAAVMAGPRNFLGQKHTTRYLRAGEVHFTRFLERGARESWEQGGSLDLSSRVQSEAERILREHRVPPLDTAQEDELNNLMSAAEKELVK
jgi:trimethylamine--corrinoid protein Co-methyltransferase